MLLAAQVKKRLDIPGHDGQWVEIRKLGWRKLRDAAEAMSNQAYAAVRALGKEGYQAVQEQVDAFTKDPEALKAYRQNAAAQFDPGMLLRASVVAWSLSDKPTPDELDDLPRDVAAWLVEEIVALSCPPRDEAAAKNA